MQWRELPYDRELIMRIRDLLANCDHDWTSWQWIEGGFAKRCRRCRSWMYDIAINGGLDQ